MINQDVMDAFLSQFPIYQIFRESDGRYYRNPRLVTWWEVFPDNAYINMAFWEYFMAGTVIIWPELERCT